jgi:hypothetical protein
MPNKRSTYDLPRRTSPQSITRACSLMVILRLKAAFDPVKSESCSTRFKLGMMWIKPLVAIREQILTKAIVASLMIFVFACENANKKKDDDAPGKDHSNQSSSPLYLGTWQKTCAADGHRSTIIISEKEIKISDHWFTDKHCTMPQLKQETTYEIAKSVEDSGDEESYAVDFLEVSSTIEPLSERAKSELALESLCGKSDWQSNPTWQGKSCAVQGELFTRLQLKEGKLSLGMSEPSAKGDRADSRHQQFFPHTWCRDC